MHNWGAFWVARWIFQSDIRMWKPSWWLKVWIYIIGTVNHTDGKQFKRGQGYFTYDMIYFDCNLKSENIKKSAIDNMLRRMKKQWKLTTHKTTRGFVITVLKYNDYQTLDNYTNDNENETQTKHKRNTNDTITKEWKNERMEENNNTFGIGDSLLPPKAEVTKVPKKRTGPTWQEKQALIESLKKKILSYWMVYDATQEKDFAGHMLSGKMKKICWDYGFVSVESFFYSVIDMSMQEIWGRLEKRRRYKINWLKIAYQKYAEVCADFQNTSHGMKRQEVKEF